MIKARFGLMFNLVKSKILVIKFTNITNKFIKIIENYILRTIISARWHLTILLMLTYVQILIS